MMGMKQRSFAPLVNVSLEELVPQEHFYRHLERTLDLSDVAGICAGDLCVQGSSLNRSSGLFQVATGVIFRGHSLGTSADAACG